MFPAALLILAAQVAAPQNPAPAVPNLHDLMIRTRQTRGLMFPQVTTWYFKGARERVERGVEGSALQVAPFVATITQCDERRIIHLNVHQKTYHSSNLPFPRAASSRGQPQNLTPQATTVPAVIVTVKSVDTGDRRQVGGYEAHRIKTTIKIKPGNGAATKKGKVKADSWYLDLPDMNCRENNPPLTQSLLVQMLARSPGHHDRVVYKYSGIEPSGLLIEEVSTQKSAGNVIKNKTEILEVSDKPLDESLFDVPAGFTQAEPGRLQPMLVAPAANQ
jgi:hypothetical protein